LISKSGNTIHVESLARLRAEAGREINKEKVVAHPYLHVEQPLLTFGPLVLVMMDFGPDTAPD